ncbi:MAG: hypothetical protein MUD00_02420 [Candidatus Pacebacteria bacterium]|jgi:hypothetical protein|nr:hypothetical protein [Candidatus Paceibacterota bacterium]
MKKVIFVGVTDEYQKEILSRGFARIEFLFFDFEDAQKALDEAIAKKYPIVLRYKTVPSNKVAIEDWLHYLHDKLPKKSIAILHQATQSDEGKLFLKELNDQGYSCLDMKERKQLMEFFEKM